MRLFYLTLSLIFFILPFSILSETMSDLIWNKGLYYKKGSKIPFDGVITGEINGSFINGKKHGKFQEFYENGNKNITTSYINDEEHGYHLQFYSSGKLERIKTFENGKEEGIGIHFKENGEIISWEIFHKGLDYSRNIIEEPLHSPHFNETILVKSLKEGEQNEIEIINNLYKTLKSKDFKIINRQLINFLKNEKNGKVDTENPFWKFIIEEI